MGGIVLHPSKGSGVQVRLSAEGKLASPGGRARHSAGLRGFERALSPLEAVVADHQCWRRVAAPPLSLSRWAKE